MSQSWSWDRFELRGLLGAEDLEAVASEALGQVGIGGEGKALAGGGEGDLIAFHLDFGFELGAAVAHVVFDDSAFDEGEVEGLGDDNSHSGDLLVEVDLGNGTELAP